MISDGNNVSLIPAVRCEPITCATDLTVVADEIASAAILTGLDSDDAADVIAVRWMASRAVVAGTREWRDQVSLLTC